MAKKSATAVADQLPALVAVPADHNSAASTTTLTPATPAADLPAKINTSNLAELKIALDDKLKEFLSLPTPAAFGAPFARSHLREDVRLGLGWASILVAAVTAYYGYTREFHSSKHLVGAGVALYVLLSAVSVYWTTFVEKDIIYEGKRRSLIQGKVHTETLLISSALHSRPPTPQSPLLALLAHLSFPTSSPLSLLRSPPAPPPGYPRYSVQIAALRLSSGGKSLVHKGSREVGFGVGEVFDEAGVMHKAGVESRIEEGVKVAVGV